MNVNEIRNNAAYKLGNIIGDHKKSKELENQIYLYARSPLTVNEIRNRYYIKYNQLCYNLKKNYTKLLSKYTISELVVIENPMLDPENDHGLKQHEENIQNYKIMINENENYDESENGGIKCGKCGYEEIIVLPKQTRSADEPMTLFCECKNCGKRFKL